MNGQNFNDTLIIPASSSTSNQWRFWAMFKMSQPHSGLSFSFEGSPSTWIICLLFTTMLVSLRLILYGARVKNGFVSPNSRFSEKIRRISTSSMVGSKKNLQAENSPISKNLLYILECLSWPLLVVPKN